MIVTVAIDPATGKVISRDSEVAGLRLIVREAWTKPGALIVKAYSPGERAREKLPLGSVVVEKVERDPRALMLAPAMAARFGSSTLPFMNARSDGTWAAQSKEPATKTIRRM